MSNLMNTLYAPFRIRQRHLTAGRIRAFRILAAVAAMGFPLLMLFHIIGEDRIPLMLRVLLVIPVVVGVMVMFDPILNTLTRTNKNLDEWEIDLKYRAESFTLRLLVVLAFLAALVDLAFSVMGQGVRLNDVGLATIIVELMFGIFIAAANYIAWNVQALDPADADVEASDSQAQRGRLVWVAFFAVIFTVFAAAGYVSAS